LARGLLIMFTFSKNQLLVSLICFFWSAIQNFHNLFLSIFFLGLAYSCFSKNLRCIIRLYIWDYSSFLKWILIAINFPFNTTFAVCHGSGNLCSCFHLILGIFYLISSVTHLTFKSIQFPWIWIFLWFSLLLVSNFIPLWFIRIQGII
jgi:hypothetical protein